MKKKYRCPYCYGMAYIGPDGLIYCDGGLKQCNFIGDEDEFWIEEVSLIDVKNGDLDGHD